MLCTFVGSILGVGVLWLTSQVAFYRSYFDQKQRNAGKDPRAVRRELFPHFWWLF